MEKFVNFIIRAAKDKDFHDSFDLSASTCPKVLEQAKIILNEKVVKVLIHADDIRNILATQGKTTEYNNGVDAVTINLIADIVKVLASPDSVDDASYDVPTGLGLSLCKIGKESVRIVLAIEDGVANVTNCYIEQDPRKEISFVPKTREDDEMLGALSSDIDDIIDYAVEDLLDIAKDLAGKSPICKKALAWTSSIKNAPFVKLEAFISACMLIEAGFDIFDTMPNILSSREDRQSGKSTTAIAYVRCFNNSTHQYYPTFTYPIFYNGSVMKARSKYNGIMERWHSNPNTILHELCHCLHYVAACVTRESNYREARVSIPRKTCFEVSEYANTNGMEFHAEILSGILSGRQFKKEVLEKCVKWKNPDTTFKKAYEDLVKKGLTVKRGDYIPTIMKGKDAVTPENVSTFKYTSEQRTRKVFKRYETICSLLPDYGLRKGVTVLVDMFCQVMNKSFDFITNSAWKPATPQMLGPILYPVKFEIPAYDRVMAKVTKAEILVDKRIYNLKGYSNKFEKHHLQEKIMKFYNKYMELSNKYHGQDISLVREWKKAVADFSSQKQSEKY